MKSQSEQRTLNGLESENDVWYLSEQQPTCPKCAKHFDSETSVRNHYTSLHSRPYPWVDTWTCEYCGEVFRRTQHACNGEPMYCSNSCSRKADAKDKKEEWLSQPVPFNLDGGQGYPRWRGKRSVAVHQLVAISNGVDPDKVFGNNKYNVDHENGHKFDNRHENIQILTNSEHGKKDADRGHQSKYTHKEMLQAVEQTVHAVLGLSTQNA